MRKQGAETSHMENPKVLSAVGGLRNTEGVSTHVTGMEEKDQHLKSSSL